MVTEKWLQSHARSTQGQKVAIFGPKTPYAIQYAQNKILIKIFGANFLWAVNFFKGSLWIKQIKIVSCKKGTQKIYEKWASKCNIVLIDKLLVL